MNEAFALIKEAIKELAEHGYLKLDAGENFFIFQPYQGPHTGPTKEFVERFASTLTDVLNAANIGSCLTIETITKVRRELAPFEEISTNQTFSIKITLGNI